MGGKLNIVVVVSGALLAGGVLAPEAYAGEIAIGTYQLHSHPDGGENPPPYGLRLDELFNATSGHDIFGFDFDHPGSNVTMTYDGTSLHITGTAFGGLHNGNVYSSDPTMTSFVNIDFTYNITSLVPGDDDLWVTTADFSNTGTITWLDTGEVFNLWDVGQAMHGYTFRLGDENNDAGHRGYPGLSGWGWVNHGPADDFPFGGNVPPHVYASDWLFTATLIPLPTAAWMGIAGLIGIVAARRWMA